MLFDRSSSSPTTVRLRKRILISVGGLSLLLLLAEVGLRTIFGLGNTLMYRADLVAGYTLLPNQRIRRLFALTVVNSRGMRGQEFRSDKPIGALRLMFLADSITYGTTQVDQEDIFVEKVRKNLSFEVHRPVEEINASANGWAISNESGFLRSHGTYDSDYVLLILNSGDLQQSFSTLSDVQGPFSSRPATAIGELLERMLTFWKQDARQDPGIESPGDPITEQANLRDLTGMLQFARARGSRFLLVFVPFRRNIAQGARSSAPKALKDWADSNDVDLFDLTDAVSAYDTKAITLGDRVHFNAQGNRLLADSLERHLVEVCLSKSPSAKGGTVRQLQPGN